MMNFTPLPDPRSVSKKLFLASICFILSAFGKAQVDHVVISQVYGGGGNNNTSTFNQDFVELFNPTGTAISLNGWSLQYSAPGNTTGFGSLVALSGTIQPGRYFLIHLGPIGSFGSALPAADLSSGAMNLGTVGGKVVLVNNTSLVAGSGCPPPPNVIDLVAWGTANCAEGNAAAAHSNFSSTRRVNSCIDTNDNSADLSTANPPTPRNSATAAVHCYPVQLAITAITPASPASGTAFSVTVETRNSAGIAQGVLMSTTIQLTSNGNAGGLIGNTTAVIPAGSSSVTITGVIFPMAGTAVTITANRVSGQTQLQPGTSAPFTVTGNANTRVRFDVASRSVDENDGTVDLTVYVIDPSTTQATSVLVALTSGSNTLIGGFTSQTLTFPANSTSPQTITLTLTDDNVCSGTEVLSFGLENVSGGQGSATVMPPSTHTLTVNDDDQAQGIQLARQFFDGAGVDSWPITAGAANVSSDPGTGDTPANQRILSAPASWQVSGATATLELGTIFPNQWENVLIRARLASLSGTNANGADAMDMVRFFLNVNGSGFPATADLTITGNNNARWGFATGTGIASTTAGTPATFAPASGGNQTAQGFSYIQIAIPAGANSIALRVIANNNNNEIWAIDNIEVVGNSCPSTYYSEANGNMTDPIWSNFPGGPPGPALINEAARVVIQNGYTVTNAANNSVNDLIVETGGVLVLTNSFVLASHGDTVALHGTVISGQGTLALVGTQATTLISSAPIDLYDLIANTPQGTNAEGSIGIRGSLKLAAGTFNATGATVTLVSDTLGTGRLADVPLTAGYVGDLTVQRYIPGGETNWRLLGSAVGAATIADWNDDFYTAGFPGSDFPAFYVDGDLWPSIRYYDETVPDPDMNAGIVGVEGTQTTLEVGRGYAVWSGDSLNGTSPFMIDVTGPPNIAQVPISLPVTFTSSGAPEADGYNLVSNPLPSAIDFEELDLGTDVQNAYYLYDPATGNNVAWSNGFGIGASNGIIQSSQGFWMKANGPDATVMVEETDKVEVLEGGAFGGLEQPAAPMLRLKVSSSINTFSDESLIVFDLGSPATDAIDVSKFIFAHPNAPQIATRSSDGHDMQIDFRGAYDSDITIPITVQVAIGGTYTINAELIGMNGLSCLSLEDLTTGEITPLNNETTYSFGISENDDWNQPRFMLHATAPIGFTATDLICAGDASGAAEVNITGDPVDVIWTDAFGTVIEQVDAASGIVQVNALDAGSYMVMVEGAQTNCGTLQHEFTIAAPYALEAEPDNMITASCPDTPDGGISVIAMGGVEPYEYLWSNGSTGSHIEAMPGTYSVTISDANGCTWTSGDLLIEASEDAPVASFNVEGTIHEVNVPINFTNTSINGETLLWEFGDVATSDESDPSHAYSDPGIYTVSLTVQGAGCTVVHSVDVNVQLGTSINDAIPFRPNNAWLQNEHIIVEHNFDHGEMVLIEVLDATGKLHMERQFAGTPGRILLPAQTLRDGIWFVRIVSGSERQTFKIPLVR